MKHALDLWSFHGRVSRQAYLAAGVSLALVKYPLDWLVSAAWGRPWHPVLYFSLRVAPLFDQRAPREWLLALGAISLPFMAAGLSLSVRRLRDMGVSPLWAAVFLVPFVHWAFMLILVVCPAAARPEDPGHPYRAGATSQSEDRPRLFARLIPASLSSAFLLGVAVAGTLGLGGYVLSAQGARLGTSLLLGVPFAMGFVMGFCTSYGDRNVGAGRAALFSMVPTAAGIALLFATGQEGVGCIVMAAPLLFGVSALGGVVGRTVAGSPRVSGTGVAAILLLSPGFASQDQGPVPAPVEVETCVEVRAPAEAVWLALDGGARLDRTPEPLFALMALPLGVQVDARSGRARFAFDNGTFEGRVTSTSAERLSIEVDRAPPALARYLETTGGSFVVHPAARGAAHHPTGGGVRLCARTSHRVHLRPLVYWERWTQRLVHTVQRRILEGVRDRAESRNTDAGAVPAWMAAAHETCPCTRRGTPAR